MSGLVNKVKEALPGNHKTTSQPEGTSGPHNSRAANAADPRIDSDRDGRAAPIGGATHHTGGAAPIGGTTHHTGGAAPIGGTTHHTGGAYNTSDTYGPASTTDGPHNSNLLNKADPRVDSDRDGSRNLGANPSGSATVGSHSHTTGITGTHHTTGTTGTHHTTGTTGLTGGNTVPEGSVGPHSSRVANAADPRVDSDLDSSRRTGTTGATAGGLGGSHATHGTHGTHHGTTGTTGTTGVTGGNNVPEGSFGPHGSRVANAADPRVDSDLDSTRRTGGVTGTTGTHHSTGTTGGVTGTTGTTGTHSTHGTHGTSGVTGAHATGPAPNTAGPHKSDLLNKADPRVDSNLDGSKTVGGNKTFSQSDELKDPTDAAQVPPSVLQKHVGPPLPTDDSSTHGKRHSVSHQEQHRGL